MNEDRALRDELEQLGASLKSAKARLEAAEVAGQLRVKTEENRLHTLRAQRDALTAQLEAMTQARDAQGEELVALERSLARARASLPASGRPSTDTTLDSELSDSPSFFTGPTPHYARQSSWLGKLVARWLADTGREWK